VADFDANPILKCLDIDGIVGSNLIRFCNWKINFENGEVTLSDQPVVSSENTLAVVSYNTDNQYDILLDLQIDNAEVKNVKLDYGSNRSISISSKDFKELKQQKVIEKTYSKTGVSQSGITGKVNKINREIALLNKVSFDGLTIDSVYIRSGKSGLIGTKVLSRYLVTIDSENRKLYFGKSQSADKQLETFGFSIGFSSDGALYIQSVIESSTAAENGVLPNMRVLKIDSLDFSENADFCVYMEYTKNASVYTIELELKDENGEIRNVKLVKKTLGFNKNN
jgi:hypothetical protein